MDSHVETSSSPPNSPPRLADADVGHAADGSTHSLSTTATTPPQRNHKHGTSSVSDADKATPVANEEPTEAIPTQAVPALTASPTSVQDIPSHEEIKEDAHDNKLAPTTAAFTSPITTSPKTSSSTSPPSSNGKLHVLADTVRQLTEQVHARDRQIRGMKGKWSRCTDLELELAGKQRLLQDTLEHNEGLVEIVYDLNVQLATREHVSVQAPTSGTSTNNNVTSVNSIDPLHEHPLKLERDHTLIQAGELSMKVADTRAMEDELRDELEDALGTIKEHYTKNQNPYNKIGTKYNNKYQPTHDHTHVPIPPQSQSQPKSPSHVATYHAVAPGYKTTINNNNYTDSSLRSFLWPGRHQFAPKQKSPPTSPPIPAWMTEILDHTESTEDESDSERSGSFPAHVTVHRQTSIATATKDTNELLPLEDVEMADAMDDDFAL